MASSQQRITPDKRMIAILVYLTACLQVIGYSFRALHESSTLTRFLSLNTALPSNITWGINEFYVGLMIASLVWAFFRWSPWPFYLIGTLFLIEALFQTALGGGMAATLSIPAECSRYLWFLAIGYALRNARTLDVEIGLPSVRLLLRLGLALTFVTHGVEAILRHPGFLDTVILTKRSLLPITDTQGFLTNGLAMIGVVDVAVGLLVLFKPNRTALVYMAFWGALTAFSHMLAYPTAGFFEALIRAPHYMLPMLILVIEGTRSLRKPIKHVYSRTLRKMGLPTHLALKRSSQDG
ncbi:MAG: hypothetical protein H7249_19405 [Chitinophagaceae bacterium]|nr:hypothetical protein [Oligoflexus sp.]